MTFARYFKASSYLLIGSGFLAIIATGGIGWIWTALSAAVFILSWFLDTSRIRQSIPAWVLNSAGLLYLPFCVLDYRFLSQSFMISILHLLLFTAAVKLLTLSKDHDYLLLYLISLAELLAASTITVNITFAVCFAVFFFSGISTLILFEMRRTNAKILRESEVQPLVVSRQLQGTGFELFFPFPAKLMTAMVLGISLLILAVLIPMFFLLPRLTSGLARHPSGTQRYTSGFSEEVELGQIGRIKKSNAVVMRVKMDRRQSDIPSDLKWRGISFDRYDGRSWKRSRTSRQMVPTQASYYKLENTTQGTHFINQTFFIEALSTPVIFATHKVLAVSRDVGDLWRDTDDTLYVRRSFDKKLRYSAVSDPLRPDPANISDLRPVPADIVQTYTQIPPEDPRIRTLAQQITRQARDRYAKAVAIENYLRSHYTYSLVLQGVPGSKDPLAVFLFDVRSGHCEYFASAMTIMLRQIGIPARLVNGFRLGEYNSIADSWTVRQYDAHSWVEAYFPPYGWIEFDPTPPEPAHPRSAFVRWISDLGEAVDLWWWEDVVNYDRSKQFEVITGLGQAMEAVQNRFKQLAASIRNGLSSAAAGIRGPGQDLGWKRRTVWTGMVAIAVLLLIRPLRRRLVGRMERTLHRGNSRIIAVSFYTEAIDLLGSHGLKRSRGQTPMEFAGSLANHPAGPSFLSLTRMYNSVRFGPPDALFRHSEADALLRSLRAALK